jgi:uncharacterized repeat protein (TIGR01451 family)
MVSLLKNRAGIRLCVSLLSVLLLSSVSLAAEEGISAEKSVDRASAKVGDVLTFHVDVVNSGNADYLSSNASGGILFEDKPPSMFKLVAGSARIRTSAGLDIPAEISRKNGYLLFGRNSPQGPIGVGLRAGQRLQLRYKMVVESGVQPERSYTNRALVRSASGVSLSDELKALVRIESEAEFDHGLILGRVFCDSDADGEQDSDERGVGGVRIYADHGWYTDTDPTGKFHIRKLLPGNHLIKVDVNTLPPGSKATTPLKQVFYVTPGLLGRVSFGIACSYETVSAEPVKKKTPEVTDKNEELAKVMTVTGKVGDLSIAVNNRRYKAMTVDLSLNPPKSRLEKKFKSGVRNVAWHLDRTLEPLVFRVRSRMAKSKKANWRLRIVKVASEGEEPVREFYGLGRPPATISWDGSSADGKKGLLERGGVYRARFSIFNGRGSSASSSEVTFGVSYGSPTDLISDKTLRGRLFLKNMKIGFVLQKVIKRMRRDLKLHPELRIEVEVHVDASADAAADLANTEVGATNIQSYIMDKLQILSENLKIMGYGSARPLGPNETKKERAYNRRVVIRAYPPEDYDSFKEPKALPAPRPSVTVQGLPVKTDAKGGFLRVVERPEKGFLNVKIVGKSGTSREALIRLKTRKKKPPVGLTDGKKPELKVKKKKKKKKKAGIDPLRRIGGEALRDALDSDKVLIADPTEKLSTATQLKVQLPPKGIKISTTRLFLPGQTHPKNTITINGKTAHVDSGGAFSHTVQLPVGKSTITITSVDATGRKAQIAWPVEVSDKEFFLMALADGVFGQDGAKLSERSHYHEAGFDDFFVAGRGALYFKGRISGTELFKNVFMTAHIDSTKKEDFSAFYEQVIDPHRDYAIFGDSSQEVHDATSRGPFYILVEADKSKLKFGTIRTEFEGVDLLRYNRTFYGGKLDFNHAFKKGFDTRLKAFASDDVTRVARGHDEIRATGGTLYYLSKGDVIDGSEQLAIIVREMATGMELARQELVRDRDYRVSGHDGRIMLNSPLPSTMDSMLTIGGIQPFQSSSMLKGHEVWIVADYETRAVQQGAGVAWGVHGSQKLFDMVEIGGGYLSEGRADGSDYEMLGAHLKFNYKKKTRAYLEFAESVNPDGTAHISRDGGIHYTPFSSAGKDTHGYAFKGGIESHLGELLGNDLNLRIKGYYQLMEPGFHAVGTVLEQGMEKYGGEVAYHPTSKDSALVRVDAAAIRVADDRFVDDFRTVKRLRAYGQYHRREGFWNVSGEATFGQHRDDMDGLVQNSSTLAVGGGYQLSKRLRLQAIQEAVLAGDPAIVGDDWSGHMLTHVGADWSLTDDFGLNAMALLRWNGDHGIRTGLRSKLSDDTNVFLEERVMHEPGTGDMMYSTVFGARRALVGGGQMYGEYRLDSGVSGPANRAVLGLGKRFTLAEGIHLVAAYERAQTFGGFEGKGSRDVLSAGLNMTGSDWVKYGGRYEVRFDQGLAAGDGQDRVQVLLRNNLNLKLSPDVTALVYSTYTMTQNLLDRTMDQESLEATAGVAYRPLHSDKLTLLGRYTHRLMRGVRPEVSTLGIESMSGWINNIDLLSLAGVLELPYGLQLTEKLVYKHNLDSSDLEDFSTDQILWINRFAVHLLERTLDFALEYRLMWGLPDGELLQGALTEVSYTLYEYARIGVGYNFARFSADVMDDLSENKNGFFIRLTGTY